MAAADSETLNENPNQSAKPVVFLSYDFGARADWIKYCARPLLEFYGCKVLSGEKYHAQEINRGVTQDIARSNLLVSFLTRNERLESREWMSSQWVLQEIGFAAGKGIPVVLVREKDVHLDVGILGNVQYIELDSDTEAFTAFPPLRSAVKRLLFEDQADNHLAVCHLAKRGSKDDWKRQWWDFWLWIDGSEESLSSIDEVNYEFPESFSPQVEQGDPQYAFGNYAETDVPLLVRAMIRFKSGKRKIVRHKVTLPVTSVSQIA